MEFPLLIMGYGKNNEANNQLKIPLPPGGGGVTNRYKWHVHGQTANFFKTPCDTRHNKKGS